MTTRTPAQPPLTLFDASQFDFEANADAKTPARLPPGGAHFSQLTAAVATKRIALDAELARVRRRRAKARLAKRRYLADNEGYERLEQTRRALHLVAD
ncbi:hypothetical protein [Candidatus Poriferisodalis sp.]|uniref:hypothetical protein n=1 Tax=Candidatus Poriferisodalis sp. TaxID=3101277 RepID=UPI003B01E7CE